MSSELHILQLADSAFPAGGFVHSNGLEAAVQHGHVRDPGSLTEFARTSLRQVERGVLGFVRRVLDDPTDFARIDSDCDLFLNNHIANRASRAQGRAMLATAAKTFDKPLIVEVSKLVRSQKLPGHLPPVFGIIARGLELEARRASELFLFMALRSTMSAAVRLGIVGPIEAQQVQAKLARELENREPLDASDGPVQTAPLLDLLQATHDRLYSRLFQS